MTLSRETRAGDHCAVESRCDLCQDVKLKLKPLTVEVVITFPESSYLSTVTTVLWSTACPYELNEIQAFLGDTSWPGKARQSCDHCAVETTFFTSCHASQMQLPTHETWRLCCGNLDKAVTTVLWKQLSSHLALASQMHLPRHETWPLCCGRLG